MKGHCPICLLTLPLGSKHGTPKPCQSSFALPEARSRKSSGGRRTNACRCSGLWALAHAAWKAEQKMHGSFSNRGIPKSAWRFSYRPPFKHQPKGGADPKKQRANPAFYALAFFFLGRIANEGATIHPRIVSEQHGGFPAPAG